MPRTYNEIYMTTRELLRARGIEGYTLEARLLTCHAAKKTRVEFLRDKMLYASPETEWEAAALTKRRLLGEPLAYIVGEWEFYGLPLEVGPGVLIPRIDTEVLAKYAIDTLGNSLPGAEPRILDLGTGSGCIGIAIASEVPTARVVLLDASDAACLTAARNVRRNNLRSRVTVMRADILAPPPRSMGSFDMIVSNPPYIPDSVIDTLDPTVKNHEPRSALNGGEDGLGFYRAILSSWVSLLRRGGHMVLEHGIGQENKIKRLMRFGGLRGVGTIIDTGGVSRVVYGKK